MAGMDEYSDMAVNGRRPAHPLVVDLATERLVAVVRAGQAVDIERLAENPPEWSSPVHRGHSDHARRPGRDRRAATIPRRRDARRRRHRALQRRCQVRDPGRRRLPGESYCRAACGRHRPRCWLRRVDRRSRADGGSLAAWRAGADVVKVFPGRVATPGYFADLSGPLPDIPLMPTGNVDLETAPAYLRAGAIALGVGKALVNPEHLAAGRLDAVRSDIEQWRRLVDDVAVATP